MSSLLTPGGQLSLGGGGDLVADDLVERLVDRVPQPLDHYELAAVIESMGITDDGAYARYGATDVFALAARVYPDVLRHATARIAAGRAAREKEVRVEEEPECLELRDTSSRGILAVVPLMLLLLLMEVLARAGWTTGWLLAMSFGASTAMLLTSGPILAIGRRAAIYIGFEHDDPARRFTALASAVTLGACIVVATGLYAGLTAASLFSASERLVFALSIGGYGLLWILTAALAVSRHGRWALVCFAAGLSTGLVVGVLSGTYLGLGVGYGMCVAGLLGGWQHVFAGNPAKRLQLPAVGPLLVEGMPYMLYGGLFSVFFLEPHVMGWFGSSDGSSLDNLRVFELSFLVALPPVLLASGFHEIALESFWRYTSRRKWLGDRASFNADLGTFHQRQTWRYTAVLAAVTSVAVVAVETVVVLGRLEDVSQLVFLSAVVAAGLLGLGQFHCLFLLSLARPRVALAATLVGIATVTIVGIPLMLVDFRLAATAFAGGAAMFAAAAWLGCRRLIGDVDHHYATAF